MHTGGLSADGGKMQGCGVATQCFIGASTCLNELVDACYVSPRSGERQSGHLLVVAAARRGTCIQCQVEQATVAGLCGMQQGAFEVGALLAAEEGCGQLFLPLWHKTNW